MNRREFIGLLAAGAAGTAVPVAWGRDESLAHALARPRLLAIVHDPRIVGDLGRCYRKFQSLDNDADALVRAILGPTVDSRWPQFPSAALDAHVEEQVQADFADGRTVTLNGWIVSVTEARQCALFSLLPS